MPILSSNNPLIQRASHYLNISQWKLNRRTGLAALASFGFLSLLWTAHRRTTTLSLNTSPKVTMTTMTQDLLQFLETTRSRYLKAIQTGKATEWTVVMGNEAGDLDSLASAIGYAWLQSVQGHERIVPLTQTLRSDLHLRPENQHALDIVGLGSSASSLLCLSDVPEAYLTPFPSTHLILVDHNVVNPRFRSDDTTVVGIVDHHTDEGYHLTADPRIIAVPTGSCASLIANLIQRTYSEAGSMPTGLAALLLSAIVVDTNGLKLGGKAEPTDRAAAAFLAPLAATVPGMSLNVANLADGILQQESNFAELNHILQDKKADVSSLSTKDLLRRDYKEYSFTPSWNTSLKIQVGLSTIPIGLQPWYAKASANNEFWREMESWMGERNLQALGVLTSFRDAEHLNKKGKPKHRREQLWLLPPGAADLAERVFPGLEGNAELDLKQTDFGHLGSEQLEGSFGSGWHARIYKQQNTDATRKATAPIVKSIIEGVQGESGRL